MERKLCKGCEKDVTSSMWCECGMTSLNDSGVITERIYPALVVNDYENAPYAQWIKEGKKKIETRMNRLFSYRGDIVICCGWGKSFGENRGKAICMVEIFDGRPMINTPEEIEAACIGWDENRKSLLLRNWRHFSQDFFFSHLAVKKNFQGIFSIVVPNEIEIIPKPEIIQFYNTQKSEQ